MRVILVGALLLTGCCGPNVERIAAFSLRQAQAFEAIAANASHSQSVRATAAAAGDSHRVVYKGLVAPEDR